MKLSPENIARLKQIVADGVDIYRECDDLKEGLRDTIKAISEELDVKPALLTKLIRTCQKNKMKDIQEDNETLDELYKAAGFH